jgi:hypothetical protein
LRIQSNRFHSSQITLVEELAEGSMKDGAEDSSEEEEGDSVEVGEEEI